jgi:mxaJ protein
VLRICADPNNLPYSDRAELGFENEIARLLGDELGMDVAYTWWPQRRGFLRRTLQAGTCDLVVGVPSEVEGVATTRPYYRSSFVFLSRADRALGIESLDAPALRSARIGIQLVGDDYANPPPATALARRGIVDNVAGYSVYGDYEADDPAKPIVDAVVSGAVDVALVWGPQAGWYAARAGVPMTLAPVTPDPDAETPFTFAMSMATRTDDEGLRDRVQQALDGRSAEVEGILDAAGVPLR